MYQRTLCAILAVLSTTLAQQEEYSPFSDPIQYARAQPLELAKRQSCESGYGNCGDLGSGADAACCPDTQTCALDDVGHVACCPTTAVCTGTIDGTLYGTGTTTAPVLGGSTTNFQTATSTIIGVVGGGSTVPNAYYPFIYIPTSYTNAALCSSAWTSCQAESTSCFASLAGVNGVTVSGIAGGTTVVGPTGTVESSASSICSSLSVTACYNLQVQNCAQFGDNGVTTVNAGGPRATPCPGMVYAMGAGAVVGAAGMMMQ